MIVTLEEPTQGEVCVFGHSVATQSRTTKSLTGFVPQEVVNHGFFSVEEILHFVSGFHGVRRNQERIDYLLNHLGLWEHKHKKVKELSGGMKRRLMIGKALVHSPKLVLLDEPTAGVDIELRAKLWKFIAELRSQGVAILLTTHYLEEAEHLCDRVGILHKGQLRKVGPTRDLVKSLTTRKVRLELVQALSPLQHPNLVRQSDLIAEFQLPSAMGVGQLLSDLRLDPRLIRDIQITEGDLEDAFQSILEGKS